MVLSLQHAPESWEGLLKCRFLRDTLRICHSVRLRWDLGIGFSVRFPGDADAAHFATTLGEARVKLHSEVTRVKLSLILEEKLGSTFPNALFSSVSFIVLELLNIYFEFP